MNEESSPGDAVSRDPRTGEVWATFPGATREEVDAAVRRARVAQVGWRSRPLEARLAVISTAARLLFERGREFSSIIARENGKPEIEAISTELATTLDILRFYVRASPSVLSPVHFGSASLALWRKRITVEREPHGVVGVIAPWNYPLMLPAGIVAPALIAGNAVVLKPSELTPSSAVALARLLADAGLPEGVLTVVQGDGATGQALVTSGIDKVFFTGSVATGRRVAMACAEQLIPCALELGGSDPALVLDDADVAHAASGILWGRYSNAGQTCVAPKRVLVHASIYESFVEALTRKVRELRGVAHGEHSDVSALIRPSQRDMLASQLADVAASGARVIADGNGSSSKGGDRHDSYMPPCVVLDAPRSARVMREETFGPILPVIRVEDEDEMVRIANDSDLGLSASVWSRNRRRARDVARRLQAGTVVINDVTLVAGVAEVPHGGVKHSGSGRAHGLAGLEECLRTRAIVDDVLPSWRQPWWFGYGAETRRRLEAYLRLAHGRTLWERLSGVRGTLALLFRPERPL